MTAIRLAPVLLVITLTVPALCENKAVLNVPCSKAIAEAELLAANRNWASLRPDPSAWVLNITTSASFTKTVLLGSLFSHPKAGEITFDNSINAAVCEVTSNGHPADVVLKDLKKKFEDNSVADGSAQNPTMPPPEMASGDNQSRAEDANKTAHTMTDSDVMAVSKAGLSPQVIAAKILSSNVAFDTSTTALIKLRESGVADSVILAMIEAQDAKTANPAVKH